MVRSQPNAWISGFSARWRCVDDDRALALGGARQRALLAALLLHANEVVSTDRLIDELWGDEPPATAAKSAPGVRVAAAPACSAAAGSSPRRPATCCASSADELDVRALRAARDGGREAMPRRGRRRSAARGARRCGAARRSPTSPYEPFAQAEIARLEELRLAALEERIDADLALGRHAELVGELEGLVAEHPLRERLRGQLMLALYRSGRQAEALEPTRRRGARLSRSSGSSPAAAARAARRRSCARTVARRALPRRPTSRAAGVFVGRDARAGASCVAGARRRARRPRPARPRSPASPGSARAGSRRSSRGRARDRGARVLVGRCWEAGGAPAYWPWVQSLRAYVRGADADTLRAAAWRAVRPELAQLLPELRDAASPISRAAVASPRARASGCSRRSRRSCGSAADGRPLVARARRPPCGRRASLLLLRFLARELGDSRVLVLGAYRDVDPTLTRPLAAAARRARARSRHAAGSRSAAWPGRRGRLHRA